MKLLRFITLWLAGLTACTIAFGAEVKPAARPALAGDYAGQWRGQNDVGGALKLKFTRNQEAAWTAVATFTFDGTDVPATTKSLKVEGNKIDLVIGWEIQGTAASSHLKGELKDDTLEGSYDSTTAEGAGVGTWKTTRTPARS
ncbi:MAG: hypothetical protein HZA93_05380 [Verrucomicrobia bacterium]|nr:hypothetical protein [Verrucomicrobiota bacterium]